LSNENQQYTIQQIGKDLSVIDKKIVSVLEDHELRLQALENVGLKGELLRLKRVLEASDYPAAKRDVALEVFAQLCDLLGITDLEA